MSDSGKRAVRAQVGRPVSVGGKPVGSGKPAITQSLTFFGFFAITASMVMTVYEYPTFA